MDGHAARPIPMLDLASARWSELAQRYGSAEDIPRLIAALSAHTEARERAEIWLGMWATLCPGRRAYSAAYATVPHLIAITAAMSLDDRAEALHFATDVESARHDDSAPRIPDDLIPAYAAAIEGMPAIVAQLAAHAWDAPVAQIMAAAMLAGKRQPTLARAILDIGRV